MQPNRSSRRFAVRVWIAFAAALFLVSSAVAAADAPGSGADLSAARTALASPGLAAERYALRDPITAAPLSVASLRATRLAAALAEGTQADSTPAPAPAPRPATKPAPKPVVRAAVVYAGKNHFWYPALGINQAVYWYPCSSSSAPGPMVYRWGCAGANNVYLLAHAGGKFRPLYNAYYAGRLKVGQLVVYADGRGKVHYFRLAWYKVTPPLASSHWAWDPQPVSSLTLQTCVGANSSLRLFVRFTEVARP